MIESMSPRSGRMLKEDDSVVNIADLLENISNGVTSEVRQQLQSAINALNDSVNAIEQSNEQRIKNINNRLIDLPFPRDPNKWDTEKVPLIDCHVADGWPTKFCSLDTEFTYKGLPTIKITSSAESPYITYLFTDSKDVTEYDYIECIIHTNDTDIVKPNYTDKIKLQVGEQGVGNTDNYESPINLYGIGTRTWKEPGWRRIRIPIREMVQNGAGDLSAVGNVYLGFNKQTSGHIEYHLAEINLIKVAKAQIYIDFDDGSDSDFTVGYPILNDLGLKATSYVNSISIGNPGKMNIEQLQYLQSVGWLVASHTHSHLSLGNEENEETIEYEIKTAFDFLKNNGIIPGCYFMSLPFGNINDTVRQIMKKYHISVRGQTGVNEDSIPANDKYDTKYISVSHETDIANYKALIDRICNSKLSYHIVFHRLTDTNPQATVNTPAKFAEICNYIAYKRNAGLCEVVTPLQTMQCEGIVVDSNGEYTLLTPEGMNLKLERTTLDID